MSIWIRDFSTEIDAFTQKQSVVYQIERFSSIILFWPVVTAFFCLGSFDGFHTTHGIFLGNFTGKFRIIIGNKISKEKVVCFSSFTLYIKTSAKKQNLKIKIFRETRFFSVVKTSIIHSLERTTPNVMLDFLVSRWRDDTFLKHPLKFFDDTSQAE